MYEVILLGWPFPKTKSSFVYFCVDVRSTFAFHVTANDSQAVKEAVQTVLARSERSQVVDCLINQDGATANKPLLRTSNNAASSSHREVKPFWTLHHASYPR